MHLSSSDSGTIVCSVRGFAVSIVGNMYRRSGLVIVTIRRAVTPEKPKSIKRLSNTSWPEIDRIQKLDCTLMRNPNQSINPFSQVIWSKFPLGIGSAYHQFDDRAVMPNEWFWNQSSVDNIRRNSDDSPCDLTSRFGLQWCRCKLSATGMLARVTYWH